MISSAALAYCFGAVLGLLAFALEAGIHGRTPPVEAAAAYSLLGGLLGAACRVGFGRLRWLANARVGTVASLGLVAAVHAAYFVNIYLLPGEYFLSIKSLSADAVVAALVTTVVVYAARSAWATRARSAWGAHLAGIGVGLLLVALAVIVWRWPRDPADPARRGEGPNLVLIVLDAVRRDRMGFEGYPLPTTPSLDALVAQARVFDSAFSGSSWTVPSVGSMLLSNGRHPQSLAEQLAAHGYTTACFTDNPHLSRGVSFLRGFDRVSRSVGTWRWLVRGTVLGEIVDRLDHGDDERLTNRISDWARGREGPFFIYAHLMDTHTPYDHPPIDGKRRRVRRIEFPLAGIGITPEESQDIQARYDGGVRSVDREVGRLVAVASSWKRPSLIVITADHGESLGEAGRWFHGQSLAAELLEVPLVVLGQGVVPGRVRTPVGHDAIPQTLLAAAGVPGRRDAEEVDLRTGDGRGSADGGLPPNLVYRIVDGYQLIVDRAQGRNMLYDLRRDPEGRHDVSARHPEIVRMLAEGLSAVPGVQAPPAAEVLGRLRALGYAD